jgi:HSP20 family protein
MALVRYSPSRAFASWPDLDLFSNRMSRVFGDVWDTPEPTGNWIPAVNVEEAANELVLTAELPGMAEDDITVDIENNILTIHGEKRETREKADEERKFHVWERRYGSFHRAFTLPKSVEPDEIRANFDNGVLTVRLPKAPQAKSRTIEVAAGKRELVG